MGCEQVLRQQNSLKNLPLQMKSPVLGFVRVSDSPLTYQAFTRLSGTITPVAAFPSASGAANALNDAGVIVGWSGFNAIKIENGALVNLGQLQPSFPSASAKAHDINNPGLIVGESTPPQGEPGSVRAFLHDGIQMTNLGTLPGLSLFSAAYAINDVGQIVGWSGNSIDTGKAFIYHNGSMNELGSLPGSNKCWATDINHNGIAIGTCNVGTNARGVLFINGLAIDINDLIPSNSGWTIRWPQSINSFMEVVGRGDFGGQQRPVLLKIRCPECRIKATAIAHP